MTASSIIITGVALACVRAGRGPRPSSRVRNTNDVGGEPHRGVGKVVGTSSRNAAPDNVHATSSHPYSCMMLLVQQTTSLVMEHRIVRAAPCSHSSFRFVQTGFVLRRFRTNVHSIVRLRSTRYRFGSILPPRQQRGQEQAPQDPTLSSSRAPPSCQGCSRPVQDGGRGAPKSASVSACGPDRESGPRRSWSWVTALRRCWQLHHREARPRELVGLGDPTRVDEYRTGSAGIGATTCPFDSDFDSGAARSRSRTSCPQTTASPEIARIRTFMVPAPRTPHPARLGKRRFRRACRRPPTSPLLGSVGSVGCRASERAPVPFRSVPAGKPGCLYPVPSCPVMPCPSEYRSEA
jgi:hypothetical protein